ncbi:MAG: AsmA family protein [Proteobacteria bacterium]|nr:AsmA family protein [Pseudomonadota bacterium]
MRKLLAAVASLVVLGIGAALILPSFVDWNRYAPAITRWIKETAGYDLTIDGTIEAALLPAPRLRLIEFRVAGGPGFTTRDLVRAKELDVLFGWGAVFSGHFEVAQIRLVDPWFQLETLADGRRSWTPALPVGAADGGNLASRSNDGRGETIRLDNVFIENGRLTWRDARSGANTVVERINARLSATSLSGPARAAGEAAIGTLFFAFEGALGQLSASRPAAVSINVDIKQNLARAQFGGSLDRDGTQGQLQGRVQIDGANLAAALVPFGLKMSGGGSLSAAMGQSFVATGALASTARGLVFNELSLQLGDARAGGGATVTFGAVPAIDMALAMTHLDLDRWRGRPTVPAQAAAPTELALPQAVDGTLDLAIETITLGGDLIRQARFNAALNRGDLIVNQAAAQLPGGTDLTLSGQLTVSGAAPRFDGEIEAASDNLRVLLEWTGLDVSGVPADRLRRFEGGARISGPLSRYEIADLEFRLDASRVSGGIAVAAGPRLGLGVDLRIDQLNVDAYRAVAVDGAPAVVGKQGFAQWLGAFDANLQLRVGSLTMLATPMQGLAIDVTLFNGDLAVRDVQVDDVMGAAIHASGTMSNTAQSPRMAAEVEINAPDAARVLRAIGFASAQVIGPLSFAGRLENADPGEIALDKFALKLGPTELGGTARLSLAGPRPKLTAGLSGGNVLLDQFVGPAVLGSAVLPARAMAGRGGGVTAPAAAWPRDPFDLSALRGIDVELGLACQSLSFRKYRLDGARLVVRLTDGVVEVPQLSGRMYRGRFEFDGHMGGRERLELGGRMTLADADLREVLVAVADIETVGGRGNLVLDLTANGTTVADLVSSLAGEATVTARNGRLDGYDLSAMNRRLKEIDKPIDIVTFVQLGLGGGSTAFSALEGRFHVDRGVARTDDLKLSAVAGEARMRGTIDLAHWTVDLANEFRLTEHPALPPFGLRLTGSLDAPRRVFDIDRLQAHLLRRGDTAVPVR